MLTIIRDVRKVDFTQLMSIYAECNLNYGKKNYPHVSVWEQLRRGEDFLREDVAAFLKEDECILVLWTTDGRAVSALRLEPYCEGMLLSCLETAPDVRGRGMASMLIAHVLARFSKQKIYVHVHKKNAISIRVHQKNGFVVLRDSACLLDGTFSHNYYTLIKE